MARLPTAASMQPAAVSSMATWPVRQGPSRATDAPALSEPNIAARYKRLIWKPTRPAGTPSASAIFGAIVGTTSTAMVPTAWIAVVSASRPRRLGRGGSGMELVFGGRGRHVDSPDEIRRFCNFHSLQSSARHVRLGWARTTLEKDGRYEGVRGFQCHDEHLPDAPSGRCGWCAVGWCAVCTGPVGTNRSSPNRRAPGASTFK